MKYPFSAAAMLLLLGACDREPPALRPPGGTDDFLRAADVLVAAQCELDRAAARPGKKFSAAKAEIALTLTVRVSESTGGGISLTIPIASTDLTIRRDRVPEGTALRKMDFRIVHRIGSTPACPTAAAPEAVSGLRYIEGGLGLQSWIAEADTLIARSGQVPTEVNYAMSFDVTVSDDRSPVFTRPLDDADGSFSRNDANAREVLHRIAVTIVPNDRSGATSDRARSQAADRFLDRIDG